MVAYPSLVFPLSERQRPLPSLLEWTAKIFARHLLNSCLKSLLPLHQVRHKAVEVRVMWLDGTHHQLQAAAPPTCKVPPLPKHITIQNPEYYTGFALTIKPLILNPHQNQAAARAVPEACFLDFHSPGKSTKLRVTLAAGRHNAARSTSPPCPCLSYHMYHVSLDSVPPDGGRFVRNRAVAN